jgi:hypothetical protein
MRDNRGPWYLLTGLVLGLASGLAYAWLISPLRYVDTVPASLRADFKDQYRSLIAVAYLASGDLGRAEERLKLLKDENPAQALGLQLQLAQAGGASESEIRGLSQLAAGLDPALAQSPSATQEPATPTLETTATLTPTPVVVITLTMTPESTITGTQVSGPRPTVTPLPTLTPSPTPGAPFVLQDQELVCAAELSQPLIQVEAFDAAGQPVPGLEIIVSWPAGEDHFFSGLKPEISLGYADFRMTPGISYTLQLAEGGEPVPDLTPRECQAEDGSRFWGSWKLVFIQP